MINGRPPRVLVAGDLNVDLVLRGDVRPRFGQVEQLLDDGALVLGSSAGIAASGLARLGIETELVAVVGDDAFGAFCTAELARVGVATGKVRVTAERSTAITVILSEPEDRAILTAVGAIGSLTVDEVVSAAANSTHVHFASPYLTPLVLPRLADTLLELRTRGVTTSIDTNWDPAERWEQLGAILPAVDLFLPNLQELRAAASALSIHATDDHARAAAIAALGPDVVVKDGARGGWMMDRHGHLTEVAAQPADVVDTTGAGDSFDAGYLAAWLEGLDARERLRWAVAAGSLSTRATGGTGAQADRAELLGVLPP